MAQTLRPPLPGPARATALGHELVTPPDPGLHVMNFDFDRDPARLQAFHRVYDAAEPIAELERLLALHRLHFFPSEPADLVPLSPELIRQLEPILLREPAGQAEKWLTKSQGSATPVFLAALRDFMYWENYDVRVRMDGKIDRVVLADILQKHGK